MKNDEWKFDIIPEIIDGKNIAEYIDPDIMKKLEELEKEEEEIEKNLQNEIEEDDDDIDNEKKEMVKKIREKKKIIKLKSKIANGPQGNARISRSSLPSDVIKLFFHKNKIF